MGNQRIRDFWDNSKDIVHICSYHVDVDDLKVGTEGWGINSRFVDVIVIVAASKFSRRAGTISQGIWENHMLISRIG